ncbi:hypothetical protein EIP91_007894 [Steccherinum ochraceum]|uniref:F-box domain-containing protein n=1 Tax=Steccherinum ochraceum TaxID=92696 RepID=A0A4R0RYI1_9APHY|nr:hypothetical protein EIP91_007894 [Steccherinum ochraceum]
MTCQDRGLDPSILGAPQELVGCSQATLASAAAPCSRCATPNVVLGMRVVPAEVRDHIIDQLRTDRTSLEACSLTCHAWLPRARHHLFKSVKVDRCCRGESFKALIDGSPTIARHIRHVELSGARSGTGSWWSGDDRYARLSGWWPTLGQRMQRQGGTDSLEIAEWLRTILPKSITALNRVTRLTLTSLHISADVAEALKPHFVGVVELVINGCQGLSFSDFLQLRSAIPQVRSIRVVEARWLPHAGIAPEPTTHGNVHVTTLEFSRKIDIVTVFDFLVRTGRHAKLTSLSCFVTSHASAKALKNMLDTLGSNLEHLGIGFSDVRDPTEILRSCDLTLISSTGLRSIRISCATTERFSTYRISLSWILHILSRVASPVIHEIVFYIPQRDLSALNLDGLIAVFSHSRYRSLQRIVFDVELSHAQNVLHDDEVRTRLSVLNRSLKFNAICR